MLLLLEGRTSWYSLWELPLPLQKPPADPSQRPKKDKASRLPHRQDENLSADLAKTPVLVEKVGPYGGNWVEHGNVWNATITCGHYAKYGEVKKRKRNHKLKCNPS